MIKKTLFIIAIMFLPSCNDSVQEVKPGEIKRIPYTTLYAVGTDSTIVIIDRRSGGKPTKVIYRFR